MRQLLANIRAIADSGLQICENAEGMSAEALRLQRLLQETVQGINALNQKLDLAEARLKLFRERLFKAEEAQAPPKVKRKKKACNDN